MLYSPAKRVAEEYLKNTGGMEFIDSLAIKTKERSDEVLKEGFMEALIDYTRSKLEGFDPTASLEWGASSVAIATKIFMQKPDHYIRDVMEGLAISMESKHHEVLLASMALERILNNWEISMAYEISPYPRPKKIITEEERRIASALEEVEMKSREALVTRVQELDGDDSVLHKAAKQLLRGDIEGAEQYLKKGYGVESVNAKTWLRMLSSNEIKKMSAWDRGPKLIGLIYARSLELDSWSYDTWIQLSEYLQSIGLKEAARGAQEMALGRSDIRRRDREHLAKYLKDHSAEKTARRVLG
jgi:hypothetical protein